jgi:primosomal protein N' (replication factor Y)
MFAEIVFFLPFRKSFTYKVPHDLLGEIAVGKRVLAPFGVKTLSGYCTGLSTTPAATDISLDKIKELYEVSDPEPLLSAGDLAFYRWMSDYYLSPFGETLKLTVPYGSELQSKRRIVADVEYCKSVLAGYTGKETLRIKILGLLIEKQSATLLAVQKAVKRKNIYSVLRALEKEGALSVVEEGIKAKISAKKERYVQLAISEEAAYTLLPEIEKRSAKQVAVLLQLLQAEGNALRLATVAKETDCPLTSFSSLAKKGLIRIFQRQVDRKRKETYANDLADYELTEQQKKVYDEVACALEGDEFKPFLLHGVTGSGKTLIYLELAKKVLDSGRSVLLLVPEISLTPQITSRFYHRFGDEVIVLHSKISPGERYDAWMKALHGQARIVIGARSALFAPLRDIGLIIIDEEHDASYKQNDTMPRYHARDCAVYKARLAKCPVLLGSATPSMESMYNAEQGKYALLELPERVDKARLPFIRLVNVIEEKKNGKMLTLFSQSLIEKIKVRVQKKEGVIVLQNRRGFSTSVYCFDCGEVETCENCSVSLVHHINENYLKCHYCGFMKPVPVQCTQCGSHAIKYFGTGTERVEDELAYYIPDAVIKRVDSDSLGKIGSFSRVLSEFREGKIDILLGTQIVSKGLDFSRVTLVCVVSAETNLWIPDFRADERTFQLLTQVSGRAGRNSAEGEVMIQTQNDRSRVLQKVVMNDYRGFYQTELHLRKTHGYPPFSRLCLLEMKDENHDKVKLAIGDLHQCISRYKDVLWVSPVSAAVLARINKFYRYQILIKSDRVNDPSGSILRGALNESMQVFHANSKYRDVLLLADMDPQVVI